MNLMEGGSGAVYLVNQMKSMILYWLRKLTQEENISATIPAKILTTIGLSPQSSSPTTLGPFMA